MAVIFPGKAVFLEHPRTGSTSVRNSLKKAGGQAFTRHAFVKAKRNEVTVASIRNPYDMLVSWWLIIGERQGYNSFAEFLTSCNDPVVIRDGKLFYYSEHVDLWMRFETLNADFKAVCQQLKIRYIPLKKYNPTRSKKLSYINYYTPQTQAIVAERFRNELEEFGYDLGGPRTRS